MPGPPPKPVEQRQREGLAGHRPLPEPLLIAGRPKLSDLAVPPAHLDEDARECWLEIVPLLIEVGLIDRVDVKLLSMLTTQWARIVQAGRKIAEEGLWATGSTGQLKEHPALKVEREATAAFERLAQSFGLSPVGRVRLGLAELHRRSLAKELDDALEPDPTPKADAEADAVEDEDDVGLPGA